MPVSTLKLGLWGASISLICSLIIFFLNIQFSSLWWTVAFIRLLLTVLFIILAVRSAKIYRAEHEGKISFSEAFGTSMSVFIIIVIVNIGFNLLQYNILDKEYGNKLKEATIERLEEQLDNPFLDDDLKESLIAAFDQISIEYKVRDAFRTLGFRVLIFTLVSMIIAATINKDLGFNTNT